MFLVKIFECVTVIVFCCVDAFVEIFDFLLVVIVVGLLRDACYNM